MAVAVLFILWSSESVYLGYVVSADHTVISKHASLDDGSRSALDILLLLLLLDRAFTRLT